MSQRLGGFTPTLTLWPQMKSRQSRPLLMGFFAIAAVGAACFWLVSGHQRPPEASPSIRIALPPLDLPARASALQPIRVVVDTLPPENQYPLSVWYIESIGAGWVDSLRVTGKTARPDGTVPALPDDILLAQGWTGDNALGMRLPYVLLTLCDTVIATVPVTGDRPDVAGAIHPHLETSGWQARLLTRHLPRCESSILKAYGVAPARRMVFPLAGEFNLLFLDSAQPSTQLLVEHAAPSLRPEHIPALPPSMTIAVQSGRAALKRCGDAKCPSLASLPRGEHRVTVLDQSPDWLLIFSDRGAGWLERKLVTASSAQNVVDAAR